MTDLTPLKRQAAELAVDETIRSGMIVGLGHGSTTIWALRRISEKLKSGELTDILGIPCSLQVEGEAKELNIPLTTLNDHPIIDVTIDGADEFERGCNLIKGGGGALLREKIVAQASKVEIIVADESKYSEKLGMSWHVPIEIIPFGWRSHLAFFTELGGEGAIRQKKDGSGDFITDQGNLILDWHFGPITDPAALAAKIKSRAGVVEHGLFISLVTEVIMAGTEGIKRFKPA